MTLLFIMLHHSLINTLNTTFWKVYNACKIYQENVFHTYHVKSNLLVYNLSLTTKLYTLILSTTKLHFNSPMPVKTCLNTAVSAPIQVEENQR